MNVRRKIKLFIDSQEFLAYLLALILSTLFIGYAPSSIALGIFIFFACRHFIVYGSKPKIDFQLILPVILYLLFTLTFFWTVNEDQTKKGLERTISLFLVPIAFNLIPKFSFKSYNLILKIFTGTNILFGMFFLISALERYFDSSSLKVFTYHDLVSDLELNAIYVAIAFSLSLYYLLSKEHRTIKEIIMIVFLLVLILLLSSKIMLFILLLAFIVYIFTFRVNKVKLFFVLVFGGLIVGLMSKNSFERFLFEKETNVKEVLTKKEFGQVYLWTGTSIRLLQLRILNEQIQEESILWKGFGLFASRENVRNRHIEFNTYPVFHSYNYHNQYAQIFSETGIFGFLLFIIMLIVSFLNALNSKNFFFLMFCFTTTFVFFTESLLWRQTGLFLFIVLYCLLNRTLFENIKHQIN